MFKDTAEALKESLSEVRALSKTLNNEVVLNNGFVKSISNELNRLKKMRFDSADLKIIGEQSPFQDSKHEIIIFRILYLILTIKSSKKLNSVIKSLEFFYPCFVFVVQTYLTILKHALFDGLYIQHRWFMQGAYHIVELFLMSLAENCVTLFLGVE